MVWRSGVLIGWRYLALSGEKQKAKIRSGQKKFGETRQVQQYDTFVRGDPAAEMAVALSGSKNLTF
jgi:hypothetical protein